MADLPLSGRVALVTGASCGIGRAAALALAKAGAHIVATARNTAALEELDDSIRAAGGAATLIPLDLLDFAKIDTLGPALAEKFGRCDIFIGNAGMLGTLGPLPHTEAPEWDRVFGVNVTANFRLIRTLDPLLRASDAGRVIFVTSGAAHGYRAYWGAYAASKAALESIARTYKAETDQTNIRVNILDPGKTRTKMRATAFPGEDPQTLPTPEDLAPLFVELSLPSETRHGERITAQIAA